MALVDIHVNLNSNKKVVQLYNLLESLYHIYLQ